MRIEVKAKLILTVPELKENESAGDVMLVAEQFINKNGLMIMPPEKGKPALSGTRVGIRIHVKDFRILTNDIDLKLECVKDQKCPDCGTKNQILEGPSAPSCTNVKCDKCGSKFNITPHGVHRI